MKIQLSEHFTYKKLLRFTLPAIIMMIFTSIYSVVDGVFVSNFVGKTPFAAINLIYPVMMILGAVGLMFGAGGSALVAKTLGEGEHEKANRIFSLIIYVAIGCGVVFSVLGWFLIPSVSSALGAEGEMLECCVLYARILFITFTAFMLQMAFQVLLVTAEKPQLGLFFTVVAGVSNIVLDYVFIVVFHWGLAGAAIATAVGQIFGGIGPLIYFACKNSSLLRLTKTKFDGGALARTCFNGSSEMMSNLASSIVNMLYNYQLMRFIGEDGVAAYGVIMYMNFIFTGIFFGFSMGSSPIVSYHYGAKNEDELKSLFRKSLTLVGIAGICLITLALVFARPLASIFVGYDADLLDLTSHGFRLYSLAFLFIGFNIYGSAFFTALNNGLISAIIAFSRMLVFETLSVLILPMILGINGIWFAVVIADILALVVTTTFLVKFRHRYHYI